MHALTHMRALPLAFRLLWVRLEGPSRTTERLNLTELIKACHQDKKVRAGVGWGGVHRLLPLLIKLCGQQPAYCTQQHHAHVHPMAT